MHVCVHVCVCVCDRGGARSSASGACMWRRALHIGPNAFSNANPRVVPPSDSHSLYLTHSLTFNLTRTHTRTHVKLDTSPLPRARRGRGASKGTFQDCGRWQGGEGKWGFGGGTPRCVTRAGGGLGHGRAFGFFACMQTCMLARIVHTYSHTRWRWQATIGRARTTRTTRCIPAACCRMASCRSARARS